jgi:transcription elongation factor Elf1
MKVEFTCTCGEPLVDGRHRGREYDAVLECPECGAEFVVTMTQLAPSDAGKTPLDAESATDTTD